MKKTGGVMLRLKRPSWGTAASSTSRRYSDAIVKPFAAVARSCEIRPTCRADASEKKGGRKKASTSSDSPLAQAFHVVIDTHTAGDPMQDGVRWTNLARSEIAA